MNSKDNGLGHNAAGVPELCTHRLSIDQRWSMNTKIPQNLNFAMGGKKICLVSKSNTSTEKILPAAVAASNVVSASKTEKDPGT